MGKILSLASALWRVERERADYLGAVPNPHNVTIWLEHPHAWLAYHAWARSLMRNSEKDVDEQEESSYVGPSQPTGDDPMPSFPIDITGNSYKTNKVRAAFDQIIADFTREDKPDLATQTAKALLNVPDASLARLHDIMAKER